MDAAKVQRVSKASSDELLSKFAELDADPPARASSPSRPSAARLLRAHIVIRKKSRSAIAARELAALAESAARTRVRRRTTGGSLAERKSLIHVSNHLSASSSLLRRMGIRRSEAGAPAISISLAVAFEKTWRKTVEGASKMFVEKHHQTHSRLISDIV